MSQTVIANVVHDVMLEYSKRTDFSEVPIEIKFLRDIIRERSALTTLDWQLVKVKTKNVLGQVKFYYSEPTGIRTNEPPTTAIIRFSESLNWCWQRFVVTKEMCHCLIDCDEDRVWNTDLLKKLAENLASKFSIAALRDKPLLSEHLAEMLALELLFPYELRRGFVTALKDGKITPYQLALRFRIPEQYAELSMYDHYMKFIGETRGDKLIKVG